MTSCTIRVWTKTKARLERRAKALGLSLPAMVHRLTEREESDAAWKGVGDLYALPAGRAMARTAGLMVRSSRSVVGKHP